jgi:cytochrome c biogenesis factor
VFAGLVNNLLPMCQPGVTLRALIQAGLIVALIFCVVMLLSIVAAHFYGVFFVNALAPDIGEPFYLTPFVWGVALLAVILAAAIVVSTRRRRSAPGPS